MSLNSHPIIQIMLLMLIHGIKNIRHGAQTLDSFKQQFSLRVLTP